MCTKRMLRISKGCCLSLAPWLLILGFAQSGALDIGRRRLAGPCGEPGELSRSAFARGAGDNRPLWVPIDSPANTPERIEHACAWDPVHDMIYMYGGSDMQTDTPYALCQRYAPQTNAWTDVASMQTPRRAIKGIYCRGKLYAIGGMNDTAVQSCEAYDIATNTWSPIAPLPSPNLFYQAIFQ